MGANQQGRNNNKPWGYHANIPADRSSCQAVQGEVSRRSGSLRKVDAVNYRVDLLKR